MTKEAFAQVMPNPVANIMHLNVNEAKGEKVNVSLVDASGRTLLQRAFVPETNQHQEEFEVSQLANGMYFLRVNTKEKQTTLKVIKVN
jgi:signal recognition particle GTPase